MRERAHSTVPAAASGAASARRPRRGDQVRPRGAFRRTQHERVIEAMIELCARRGYHAVAIAELCSRAGISHATFYQLFEDKEDCFLSAYRTCSQLVFGGVHTALAGAGFSEAPRFALESLFKALERDPDAGRILFIEALGVGPEIANEQRRELERVARDAKEMHARASDDARALDVPLIAVVGALRHIISRHLRTHAVDQLPALVDDSLAWLVSYAVPAGSECWSTSPAARLQEAPRYTPRTWQPTPLPPGTHGLAADVIARSQRTRLIFATAEAMMANGYARTQIKDIVAAARVARPVFYEYFADREDAFLEAQQYPTHHVIDRCAEAYFSVPAWPERIWRHLHTLLRLLCENPALSHVRLVECYAAGPKSVRRAEDMTRSFTIFLEEGYQYSEKARALPKLSSQAIAGAIFEIVRHHVARGEFDALPAYLPQLTYLAIAPFTGVREAIELVEKMKARQDARGWS